MTLTEILPNARLLPAADKLRLIRLLLVEIDDSDDVSPLEHGRTYAVPTPQFEPGAAAALLQELKTSAAC